MPASTFADRLRELREAAGLSQYALAKQADISKQAVSSLELGEREPTWATVQALAKALGVDCMAFQTEARKIITPSPVKKDPDAIKPVEKKRSRKEK
ncbi:MAG TPA: helix-turn-helix transcriptional regulator [Gemmataceae bacterium]|nr:helix-turn-helix transcriptional regulator [Gemmataceae bacterium]